MDHAGSLRGSGALQDGPRADFLGAGGEVALQAQQVIRRARHGVEGGFGHSQGGEHLVAVGLGQLGQLALDLGAHHHHLATVCRGVVAHLLDQGALAGGVLVIDVGHEEHRLGGDHSQGTQDLALFLFQLQAADGVSCIQAGLALLQDGHLGNGFLVAAAGRADGLVQDVLHHLHVGQHQLGLDGADVPDRVHRALDVHDVRVLEAANHVEDGVHLADVAQELVAQAFALAGAADDAGDVHQTDDGGDDLLALDELLERGQPGVRHGDHADVRLDGAEGVVGRLDPRRREGVEERALSDVRETDDSCFHRGRNGTLCRSGRPAPRDPWRQDAARNILDPAPPRPGHSAPSVRTTFGLGIGSPIPVAQHLDVRATDARRRRRARGGHGHDGHAALQPHGGLRKRAARPGAEPARPQLAASDRARCHHRSQGPRACRERPELRPGRLLPRDQRHVGEYARHRRREEGSRTRRMEQAGACGSRGADRGAASCVAGRARCGDHGSHRGHGPSGRGVRRAHGRGAHAGREEGERRVGGAPGDRARQVRRGRGGAVLRAPHRGAERGARGGVAVARKGRFCAAKAGRCASRHHRGPGQHASHLSVGFRAHRPRSTFHAAPAARADALARGAGHCGPPGGRRARGSVARGPGATPVPHAWCGRRRHGGSRWLPPRPRHDRQPWHRAHLRGLPARRARAHRAAPRHRRNGTHRARARR